MNRRGRPVESEAIVSGAPHGTVSGYTSHACRCGRCREAIREHIYAYKETRKGKPALTHGPAGYTYGCRCEVCSEAMREYQRGWRKRRAGSEGTEEVRNA